MQKRRLEDRIHDLIGRAIKTKDEIELNDIIRQLQVALHEHSGRLRKLAAEKLTTIPGTGRTPSSFVARSSTKQDRND